MLFNAFTMDLVVLATSIVFEVWSSQSPLALHASKNILSCGELTQNDGRECEEVD